MSEPAASDSVPDSVSAVPAVAAPDAAGGWVVFERDGDICAGILANESERRARVTRSEGAFKILKTRVWGVFSCAPESEAAADAQVDKAREVASGMDAEPVWEAAQGRGLQALGLAELVDVVSAVGGELGGGGSFRSGVQPPTGAKGPTGGEGPAGAEGDSVKMRAVSLALQNPAYFRRGDDGRFVPAPREEMEKARDSLRSRRARRDAEREIAAQLEAGEVPPEIAADAVRMMTVPEKGTAAYRALKRHVGGDGPEFARFFIKAGVLADERAYFSAVFERAWRTRAAAAAEAEAGGEMGLLSPPEWPDASATAFSVDDAGTTEVDDAFSATKRGDGKWRIGVHIAAPAAAVARGSAADKIARARGISVYFPDDKRPMLPPEVLAACSLDAGKRRAALSLYFNLDPASGEISGEDTAAEMVTVAEAFTPEQWNAGEVSGAAADVFAQLMRAAMAMPEEDIRRPERDFKIRVRDDVPEVVRVSRGPAEATVEGLMRKVNHAWGGILAKSGGGVFRHRGMTLAEPESPPYAWTTSPLRRYADLANQRLLLSHLSGEFLPPENWPALARKFDDRLVLARRGQRTAERWWALRALAAVGKKKALAAQWREDGRVQLEDFPLSGDIRGATPGAEGTGIQVRLGSVDFLRLRVRFYPMGKAL